jgi:hypothetical protein
MNWDEENLVSISIKLRFGPTLFCQCFLTHKKLSLDQTILFGGAKSDKNKGLAVEV